ncbi:DNA cytosine methyltransferase [Paenibacillus barengoltzii]|uniref:DNA cytosine methyltransferase n=1 Tax=Paenibacillus barengoltzii TaxID=343517 RepID=UPI002FDAA1DC
MDTQLTYIDLFAGCGGLSLGLHKAGWKGLFAVEKSRDAFETLSYNLIKKCGHFDWPEWLSIQNYDIKEIIEKYKDSLVTLRGKVDLIAGGPPCQGFSMAGRRDEKDERNQLILYYVEFIKIIRPKVIFFENVKGFTVGFDKKRNGKPYSDIIQELLEGIGYRLKGKIVDFSNFGIPQRRKRFILIGSLHTDPSLFFERLEDLSKEFLLENHLKQFTTVSEALSDLLKSHGIIDSPDTKKFYAGLYGVSNSNYQRYLRKGMICEGKFADSHRFANHKEETVSVFKNIVDNAPKNKRLDGELKSQFNLKRRGAFLLDGDDISPTLTSNPDDYLHYSEPRILTVREYARIQSFPDWYEFKGKYTTGGKRRVHEVPRYTQIGNAIPPLFSEQAGLVLKEMVTNE